MYNNDEMYEVDDFDNDIDLRKELIEKAKELQEGWAGSSIPKEVMDLQRSWKKIAYWDSAFEDKLAEEFDASMEFFYGKKREMEKNNHQAKEELIASAKKISSLSNLNEATKEMTELMQSWKEIGTASREKDEELWNEFNGIRQTFFDKKQKFWEDRKEKFAKAHAIKLELITKVDALKDSEDWKATGEQLNQLMNEWKAVGSAGKEHEDALWNEFNGKRQVFYDNRNNYYEEMSARYDVCYQQKVELVEKAKEILNGDNFNRNNTEAIKLLSAEWKKIGSCGKEKEDAIWNTFHSITDAYFHALREQSQQKQERWRQGILDARTAKLDLIQKQKRQIAYLQNDIVGLIGERAVEETLQNIEDTKAFIKELEQELTELDTLLQQ